MCIVVVKSNGDWSWRWGMLYALICDGIVKEISVKQSLKFNNKMRSRGRMLELISSVLIQWSRRTPWPRPDRGRLAQWHGWWALIAQHNKEEIGAGARTTRFTVTVTAPPSSLVRSRGVLWATGSSTAVIVITGHRRHYTASHYFTTAGLHCDLYTVAMSASSSKTNGQAHRTLSSPPSLMF
jgi:hypothetical protein